MHRFRVAKQEHLCRAAFCRLSVCQGGSTWIGPCCRVSCQSACSRLGFGAPRAPPALGSLPAGDDAVQAHLQDSMLVLLGSHRCTPIALQSDTKALRVHRHSGNTHYLVVSEKTGSFCYKLSICMRVSAPIPASPCAACPAFPGAQSCCPACARRSCRPASLLQHAQGA